MGDKRLLLVLLIFLTGCFNTNVREYTKEHKGVTCSLKNFDCGKGSFYRNGDYVESECTYNWLCSDGVIVKDKE
jgi:hypothetical protein